MADTDQIGSRKAGHIPYVAGHTDLDLDGKLLVACAHCTTTSVVPLRTRRLKDGPDGEPRFAKIRPIVDYLTAPAQEQLLESFLASHVEHPLEGPCPHVVSEKKPVPPHGQCGTCRAVTKVGRKLCNECYRGQRALRRAA